MRISSSSSSNSVSECSSSRLGSFDSLIAPRASFVFFMLVFDLDKIAWKEVTLACGGIIFCVIETGFFVFLLVLLLLIFIFMTRFCFELIDVYVLDIGGPDSSFFSANSSDLFASSLDFVPLS